MPDVLYPAALLNFHYYQGLIEAKIDHGIQYLGAMNLGAQIKTENVLP